MSKRGFTLIELLIVVAIIAILAAIAVPNFLEAQTRSKVSRVKADFRSLATALESYRVDSNTYPYGASGANLGDPNVPADRGRHGFGLLIRPIAYITSIPEDPFGDVEVSPGNKRMPLYEMGCGKAGVASAGRSWSSATGGDPPAYPIDIYALESFGPDKVDDTGNTSSINEFARLGGSSSTGAFPVGAWNNSTNNSSPEIILNVVYDPTNGTVSSGQVWRTGGAPGDTETLNEFLNATRR